MLRLFVWFVIPFDWLLLLLIAVDSNKYFCVVDIIRMVVASSIFWHIPLKWFEIGFLFAGCTIYNGHRLNILSTHKTNALTINRTDRRGMHAAPNYTEQNFGFLHVRFDGRSAQNKFPHSLNVSNASQTFHSHFAWMESMRSLLNISRLPLIHQSTEQPNGSNLFFFYQFNEIKSVVESRPQIFAWNILSKLKRIVCVCGTVRCTNSASSLMW